MKDMDSNKSSPESSYENGSDSEERSEMEVDNEDSENEDEETNSENGETDHEEEDENESEDEESESEDVENGSVSQSEEISEESDAKEIIKLNDCSEELYTGGIDSIEDMLSNKPFKNFEMCDENELKTLERNEPFFKNCNKKWGWKEELQLLEYVEDCGLFNWKCIADRLTHRNGSKFEISEVQEHFNKYYLEGTLGQIWNYRLVEKPVLHFDHTEDDPVDESATSKYLPNVPSKDLKSIKFLPHREEFEVYPPSGLPMDPEMILLKLDFSSYYMSYLKDLKIDEEVRHLQLAIVDSYRRTVSERIAMRKFMKDYNLIEQFFYKETPSCPEDYKRKSAICYFEKEFQKMQKFIPLFDSSAEFTDFYFSCVKEELLKMEIARLLELLKARRSKENINIPRSLEMKTLLGKRAPACYSILTKLLYYTGQGGKKGNSNLPEENGQSDIKWLNAHMNLKEGLLQKKIQVIRINMSGAKTESNEISFCQR